MSRTSPEDPANGPWHLDKRVPVALILALVVQTFGLGWWAASISWRVTSLERWKDDSKEVAADIAVVKSQISDIKATVQRIDDKLNEDKGMRP